MTDPAAFSRSRGGSIVDSLSLSRENVRGAREVESTEVGECLDATYNGLAEREWVARRLVPREFFGYVETNVESHAWVQAWTGSWWSHDPTDHVQVNDQHVAVAIGRDYARVSPLKGIFSGGGDTP